MPIVHDELRRLARKLLAGERRADTLQPTVLVNEAFLRLVTLKDIQWQNRAHFLAMAARLMRRVLVDAARARRYQKRGGGVTPVTLDTTAIGAAEPPRDVVALHDALEALAAVDRRKSDVVELRFFGGLSVEETAEALGISTDTVTRDWKLARVWLMREMASATAATPRRPPR
jgi:RNA polymerase sigma factor (TIGR02999 family)